MQGKRWRWRWRCKDVGRVASPWLGTVTSTIKHFLIGHWSRCSVNKETCIIACQKPGNGFWEPRDEGDLSLSLGGSHNLPGSLCHPFKFWLLRRPSLFATPTPSRTLRTSLLVTTGSQGVGSGACFLQDRDWVWLLSMPPAPVQGLAQSRRLSGHRNTSTIQEQRN